MTLPRFAPPGTTYTVTRRCWDGLFCLVPRPWVKRVFGYCLALAAHRYDIGLHGFDVMSNHWHGVLTDPYGQVDRFMSHLHGLTARAINVGHGRRDGFWSRQPASLVRLETEEAVMEALVYVHTNPVKAGLTHRGDLWPGLRGLYAHTTDHAGTQKRPKKFFRRNGPCPERVSLKLTMPPQFTCDRETFRKRLAEAVREREEEICEEMKRDGRTFMGARAAQRQRWDRKPAKPLKRSRVSPTVKSRDVERRVHMLRERAIFLQQYQEAYAAWCRGDGSVVFPAGTLKMKRFPRVRIRGPDD